MTKITVAKIKTMMDKVLSDHRDKGLVADMTLANWHFSGSELTEEKAKYFFEVCIPHVVKELERFQELLNSGGKMNEDSDGNIYCFSYLPNGKGGFKIVKLVKGKKGYFEYYGHGHFYSEEEIRKEVLRMNTEGLSLDKNEVLEIEVSTL